MEAHQFTREDIIEYAIGRLGSFGVTSPERDKLAVSDLSENEYDDLVLTFDYPMPDGSMGAFRATMGDGDVAMMCRLSTLSEEEKTTRKDAVLKLLEPWVGVRSAEPVAKTMTASDEVEVRVFDWDKIKNNEDIHEQIADLFGDSDRDDFVGLRKLPEDDDDLDALADNWFPIAITGTGGQTFISHDSPDFAFPMFSSLVLVNLDEFAGEETPLYCLPVSGTFVPSKDVPRFIRSAQSLQIVPRENPRAAIVYGTYDPDQETLAGWDLCEPLGPEGDI